MTFLFLSFFALVTGALLPAAKSKQRAVSSLFGLVIVIFTYSLVVYQQQTNRIVNIEKAAALMVQEQNKKYTELGFIHASLVFLEKNKDLYPDSYKRAVKMCVQYQCDSPRANLAEMTSLSQSMSGLLSGLTALNKLN